MAVDQLMLFNENNKKIAILSIRIIIFTLGFNIFVNVMRIILKIVEIIQVRLSQKKIPIVPIVTGVETVRMDKIFE